MDIETPFLAALSPEARERVNAAAVHQFAAAGEVIVSEGEIVNRLFIIGSGEAQVVSHDVHGRLKTLAHLHKGEFFGELSLLSGEPVSATVRAVRDTELWTLSHEDFASITDEFPELAKSVAMILGERLKRANERYLQTRRGKLAVLVSQSQPVMSAWLSYHLASSIAKHSGQPIALVDLSGTGGDQMTLPGARPLDGATAHEGLNVFIADDQRNNVQSAIELLRDSMAHVLIHVGPDISRAEARISSADSAILMIHETNAATSQLSGEIRRLTKSWLHAAVVSDRTDEITVGEMNALQGSLGPEIRFTAVIPGGAAALEGPDIGASATLAAIGRLARSYLGVSVGLALGGGGAKGYAHIGVLRVLKREAIIPDVFTGCSIGAPIAAGAAAKWSIDDLRDQLDMISKKAVRLTLPFVSLLNSSAMRSELDRIIGDVTFEELTSRVGVMAVDINTGEEALLQTGEICPALMASMAYPGIYAPVKIGSRRLVDGGLLNPVPVSAAIKLGADLVISSTLAGAPDAPNENGDSERPLILRTITRSLEIMQSRIGEQSAGKADVEIRPIFDGQPGLLDFKRGKELEEAGERAAEEALPKLRDALPWLS